MLRGRGFGSAWRVGPRQEFVDPAHEMAADDLAEHFG